MWPVRQDFEKFVNEYAEKQQEAIDAFRSAPQGCSLDHLGPMS